MHFDFIGQSSFHCNAIDQTKWDLVTRDLLKLKVSMSGGTVTFGFAGFFCRMNFTQNFVISVLLRLAVSKIRKSSGEWSM